MDSLFSNLQFAVEEGSSTERFWSFLHQLSNSLGSGNLTTDAMIVLGCFVILGGVALLFAFFATGSANSRTTEQKADRFEAMMGRLERTERTLHEFRTDVLRSLELIRTEVEFSRNEIEVVRNLVETTSPIPSMNLDSPRVRRPSRENILAAPATESLPVTPSEEPPAYEARARRSSGSLPTGPEAGEVETLAVKLKKTRTGMFERIRSIFGKKPTLDSEAVEDLEAVLVGSDLGIKTVRELLTQVKEDVAAGAALSEGGLSGVLKLKLLTILQRGNVRGGVHAPHRTEEGPLVILVVGVNGAGKTTSVAKLAHQFKAHGSNVLLVAADTFRAAAVEQLHEWGRRLGVPVVSGAPDAKPQTVVFDAMERATQEPIDCVIIDTAGRLHTKQSLMDELTGIRNVIQKHQANAPQETLLVLDGSTGQNALTQAREFNDATKLTGMIITKLDGTSKGGIVVAIKEELGIPVRYIGVGESKDDLRPFDPKEFVDALFERGA